jgi:hypothetical protein
MRFEQKQLVGFAQQSKSKRSDLMLKMSMQRDHIFVVLSWSDAQGVALGVEVTAEAIAG